MFLNFQFKKVKLTINVIKIMILKKQIMKISNKTKKLKNRKVQTLKWKISLQMKEKRIIIKNKQNNIKRNKMIQI